MPLQTIATKLNIEMLITELQPIIDALNAKKFTQNIGLSEFGGTDLTELEQDFIEKYQPQQALIIYGSLAPGRPNHSKVEMIKGMWQQGIVRGKLESKGWGADLGFNGFVPAYGQNQIEIPVHVLFSNELTEYWNVLDEFEGDGYQRILALFTLEDGRICVGNIYGLNMES